MKKLILVLVICVSLIGCSKKENLIRKSKNAYENKVKDIFKLSDSEYLLKSSMLLTELRIKRALLIHDTTLYKIYSIDKEKYDSIDMIKSNKLDKLISELDSLLENDPILIERGILISDDYDDINLKFDYFKKINK